MDLMAHSALHTQLLTNKARLGLYGGVETAVSFIDAAGELRGPEERCGAFYLSWRAKITVAGKDRARWLHNMVTNQIRELAPAHGNYDFILSPQGRILADLYIYNRGEDFLLDTDVAQVETVVATLRRFIIMDKVELELLSSSKNDSNDISAS